MQRPSQEPHRFTTQILYIVSPLLLAIVLFSVLRLSAADRPSASEPLPTQTRQPTPPQAAAEPPTPEEPTADSDGGSSSLPTATAVPTSAPTATALPTPLPEIVLLGPPAESTFRLADSATFYWKWQGELDEDYGFVLLFSQSDAFTEAGETKSTDNASVFRLRVPLGEAWAADLPIQWRVVLEESKSGTVLAESDARTFSLYVYNR